MRRIALSVWLGLALSVPASTRADSDIRCYDIDGKETSDVPCRPHDTESQPNCCRRGQDCLNIGIYAHPEDSDEISRWERQTCTDRDWSASGCKKYCPMIAEPALRLALCGSEELVRVACLSDNDDFENGLRLCQSRRVPYNDTMEDISGNELKENEFLVHIVDKPYLRSRDEQTSTEADDSDEAEADDQETATEEDQDMSTDTTTDQTQTNLVAGPDTTTLTTAISTTSGTSNQEAESPTSVGDSVTKAGTTQTEESSDSGDSQGSNTMVIVAASLGSFGGVCFALLIFFGIKLWRKRRHDKQAGGGMRPSPSGQDQATWPQDYERKPELPGDGFTYYHQHHDRAFNRGSMLRDDQFGPEMSQSPQSYSRMSNASYTGTGTQSIVSPISSTPQELPAEFERKPQESGSPK